MDTIQTLITVGSTVAGSGIGSAIVGAWFKRKFDGQLETQKSLFQRQSKVHERQLDALCDIYQGLMSTSEFLKQANRKGFFASESAAGYSKKFFDSLEATSKSFNQRRLLLPSSLAASIDAFFAATLEGHRYLSFAYDKQMPDGETRKNDFDKAATIALEEVPTFLAAIEIESRRILGIP